MDKLKALWDFATQYPFLAIGTVLVLIGAIGLVPLGTHPYPIPSSWRWILLALGLVLIAIDIIRYVRSGGVEPSLDLIEGSISRPADNATVTRSIDAGGRVKGLQKDQHLWLIIEVGTQKWPKSAEIQPGKDGEWQRTIFEDGAATSFALSLFVANKEGHKKILAWLEIGPIIGYRPFEADIPGTRRLARAELKK
jgi:hypothetical protein